MPARCHIIIMYVYNAPAHFLLLPSQPARTTRITVWRFCPPHFAHRGGGSIAHNHFRKMSVHEIKLRRSRVCVCVHKICINDYYYCYFVQKHRSHFNRITQQISLKTLFCVCDNYYKRRDDLRNGNKLIEEKILFLASDNIVLF